MLRAFRLSLRRRAKIDVDEELAFHLDMRASELITQGWNADDARTEARRQFGDLEDARSYCRRSNERRENRIMRSELLTGLQQDFTYALRTLRKAPAFTLIAVLTLALGVGANTAIFSVVRGILLRPLPFQDPGQLVMVAATYAGSKPSAVSPANIADWRTMNRSFTSISTIGGHAAVLTGAGGDAERVRGFDVSGDFFTILGVPALRGRNAFTPEESAWQGPKAVLIAESLWRTRFGSDSALVGSMITLDNERYLVEGIIPNASAWPTGALVWFPFAFDPAKLADSRGAVYLSVVGRLKPGITLASATADMKAVGQRLEEQYPVANSKVGAAVVPLQEYIAGNMKEPLLVLLAGVAFVLLIACANVANLTLVRGVSREGELAVRTALGAARGRLVRQLVTESLVLAGVGGAVGLALAVVGTRLLVNAAPASIPRLSAIHIDGVVLAFAMFITLVTGVVFGLIPARQVLNPNLSQTLREGGRSGASRAGSHRVRRTLVVAEVALSVMLLAGAGLLIRSFTRLMDVDPGFRTASSISFGISLPNAKYGNADKQSAFMTELMGRMKAIPGVEKAGAAYGLPLTNFSFDFSFEIAGAPPVRPQDEPSAEVRVATASYFPAIGIRTLRGRGFTEADRNGATPVLLITETGAKQFFPHDDPIGKHVTFGWGNGRGKPLEGDIVGIVADAKQSSLATATLPQFYAPYDQRPVASFSVVLHTTRDPQLAVADARRVVHEMDPDLAVSQIKLLDQLVAESVAQPRFYMVLLAALALVAVVLAAVGIYGVIAYLVGQRTREIGIRIALGAPTSRVVRLVVGEGALLATLGLVGGLAGAFALTRLMGTLLYDIKPTDPLTYIVTATFFVAVALVAAFVPALRATRVDPVWAMRAE